MSTTDARERQLSHREVWASKPVLREVYGHLYRRIAAACKPGLTIEVGGGSGNFKEYAPDVLSFDIVHEPWLDFVADAQALPLQEQSAANIVMLDVLHHIEYPIKFFKEAARTLQPGGRLIFVEPGITPISNVVYKALHEEPVDATVDPLVDGRPDPSKNPYVGNQAIPTLLVTRHATQLFKRVPELALKSTSWLGMLAYPLSGGFKRWSLITPAIARSVLRFEDRIEAVLGRACGFRMLAIYEKRGA